VDVINDDGYERATAERYGEHVGDAGLLLPEPAANKRQQLFRFKLEFEVHRAHSDQLPARPE